MAVPKTISQRELRNNNGDVMRAVEHGQSYTVTRNGKPIASLVPFKKAVFAKKADVIEAFRNSLPIDAKAFFEDIDRFVDQDPTPRA